jgi:Flp pilus assembly protein TadD
MPRWRVAAVVAAAIVLGAATVARNQDYRSEVALWSDTTRKSPHSARAWNNLGYAYQLEGRRDEARAAYERALALDPQDVKARTNLRLLEGR